MCLLFCECVRLSEALLRSVLALALLGVSTPDERGCRDISVTRPAPRDLVPGGFALRTRTGRTYLIVFDPLTFVLD
ncbi:hypothetical protein BOTBODRAFT_341644 [Botryobasidium botryosum FD-172 SS1]|uniref:Secreted protein n=1 Tax=Botryobasidium botryosum (strain FD-172 SS1) TaxID=930990 RepID=A0A067LTN1_BOTB1|nr:hypothetical protein BOTBODRAFT_341644 [Botryobasidium botryosum FD-172 SS1]